jgi:hypothetical protein
MNLNGPDTDHVDQALPHLAPREQDAAAMGLLAAQYHACAVAADRARAWCRRARQAARRRTASRTQVLPHKRPRYRRYAKIIMQ